MLQRKPGRMGRALGVSTGWVLRLLLAKRKVAQMTGVTYDKIDAEGVHVTVEGERRIVPADTIVICTGQEPNRALYDELIAAASRPTSSAERTVPPSSMPCAPSTRARGSPTRSDRWLRMTA